jgi:cob(I)alamin adenosyltransferase
MNPKDFKIYTKKGDKGETSLIGGSRVAKSDLRIEAYGTLDELNSFIGLIRDFSVDQVQKDIIGSIQSDVFIAESIYAADSETSLTTLPKLTEKNIELLESEIDRMNEHLPELKNFILPGGHPVVSFCHIARTVCRRAERILVKLQINDPDHELVVKYINRLSDYLFVLARFVGHELGVSEQIWKVR